LSEAKHLCIADLVLYDQRFFASLRMTSVRCSVNQRKL
jgi:hypothetical protein